MAEQIEVTAEKRKRGRPRKTPIDQPKQRSETKQFPLTFKCNSDLEMDLYNHLVGKYYRGAYIKELLIHEMFLERPDLAVKYGATVSRPTAPPPIVYNQEPIQDDPIVNIEVEEEITEEPESVIKEDQEPIIENVEEETEPPKPKRGMDTLSMF